MGLDVASVPDRLPFITEAVNTKEAVTTPMTTRQFADGWSSTRKGMWCTSPSWIQTGRVVGLVVGPVLIEPLIQAAVPPALAAGLDWSILTEQATVETSSEDLVYITEATIGDQTWRLAGTAGSGLVDPGGSVATSRRCLDWPVWPSHSWRHLATFWYLAGDPVKDRSGKRRGPDVGQRPVCGHRLPRAPDSPRRRGRILGTSQGRQPRRTWKPSERNEIISTIADQAGDLANIVEDLLVVARADHGTLATVAVPVDVAANVDR